ncbi:hypothetical protein [Gordonia sp. (in: high G+C Gram-positive bacteria)]|uniref:hypothetical protein n=1 Tax=unclassified Gordonia (in: high G+C Gram-positive bacteria) TaxID=2657482 RepID=UPI0026350575|nr:hypothetical protein [Gordonia sp. (in: high G+C Gram-positive bacteria)]
MNAAPRRLARTTAGLVCAAAFLGLTACGGGHDSSPAESGGDSSVVDSGPTLATGDLTDCQAALQVSAQIGQYLELYNDTADLRDEAELPSAVPLGFIENSQALVKKMNDDPLRTVVVDSIAIQKRYNAALAANQRGQASTAVRDQSGLFTTALDKCGSTLSADDRKDFDRTKAAYAKGFPAK